MISGLLTGCGPKQTVVGYGDEEAFEYYLEQGENLEGKVVRFTPSEFHPDSALGYNLWAGKHLNFVSKSHPNIEVGRPVVVRALTIQNNLGSWIITYEKVENPVENETTIYSVQQNASKADSSETESSVASEASKTTETTISESSSEESVIQNIVVINDSLPIEVKDYGCSLSGALQLGAQ